jgi:hypothetical protein
LSFSYSLSGSPEGKRRVIDREYNCIKREILHHITYLERAKIEERERGIRTDKGSLFYWSFDVSLFRTVYLQDP